MPRRKIFRRRRRRLSETFTTVQCFGCMNVYRPTTCSAPVVDAFMIAGMSLTRNPNPLTTGDTAPLASGSDKFLTFDGCKFQFEHIHDPQETLSCSSCDPAATAVAFLLRIWEALVVLPLAPATTTVPLFIPNLSRGTEQGGDVAERVLWKRISYLPIWGIGVPGGLFPQLASTHRDEGHGPVVVKSRVKLDDRHALFYVRNFVHDVVLPDINNSPNSCDVDCTDNHCSIPIQHDAWFKTFYHTRK